MLPQPRALESIVEFRNSISHELTSRKVGGLHLRYLSGFRVLVANIFHGPSSVGQPRSWFQGRYLMLQVPERNANDRERRNSKRERNATRNGSETHGTKRPRGAPNLLLCFTKFRTCLQATSRVRDVRVLLCRKQNSRMVESKAKRNGTVAPSITGIEQWSQSLGSVWILYSSQTSDITLETIPSGGRGVYPGPSHRVVL